MTFDEEYEDWLSKEPVRKVKQINADEVVDKIYELIDAFTDQYRERHPEPKQDDAKREAITQVVDNMHDNYGNINIESLINDLYRLPSFIDWDEIKGDYLYKYDGEEYPDMLDIFKWFKNKLS